MKKLWVFLLVMLFCFGLPLFITAAVKYFYGTKPTIAERIGAGFD